MWLYIDKANVESMVKAKDPDMFYECTRMICRGIDVHYNFQKQEMMSNPYLQIWFRKTKGQGVQNRTEFTDKRNTVLPDRPVHIVDFGNGKEDVDAIYLLDDKKACDDIEKHNCILIGDVGKEYSIFEKMQCIESDHEIALSRIGSWSNYISTCCPNFPLTDIVLVDNYYFVDRRRYEANDNDLIRKLVSSVLNYPVNLVILSDNNNLGHRIYLEDEVDVIRDILIDETGNDNCNVTIVMANRNIHDRELITNYFRIKSGAGFLIKNA